MKWGETGDPAWAEFRCRFVVKLPYLAILTPRKSDAVRHARPTENRPVRPGGWFGGVLHGSFPHDIPFDFARLLLQPSPGFID